VALEERSTHFQSSLMRVPREAPLETSSTVLNTLARLI